MDYVLDSREVCTIRRDDLLYGALKPPFHPSLAYPEYSGPVEHSRPNPVFDAVREAFRHLNYDSERFDTAEWSPLRFLVSAGSRVLVKLAMTTHRNSAGDTVFAIIPHGSVIRPVLEYLAMAKPESIILADGPIPNSDFREVAKTMGLWEIAEDINTRYGRELISLLDLRDEYSPKDGRGVIIDNLPLAGDPLGYVNVNLGADSELASLDEDWTCYRSVSSHPHERFAPPIYHNKRNHVYSIPRTVLQSDVIVNISKLKTHRKVGLTCTLKNVVGITNRKYWLPHFREGIDASYLDVLPAAARALLGARDLLTRAVFQTVRLHNLAVQYPCRDGNWPGDDTTWRMVLDLYRIMLLANSRGEMTAVPQRRHFSVIDGIVGGGGFGPLAPRSILSRTLILGINPRSVDAVAAHVMGYDPAGIRLLGPHSSPRYHIPGESNIRALSIVGTERPLIPLGFKRPRAWRRLPPSSPI